MIDRGPYSREAVDLLKRLQKEAAVAKGEVVRLCGNHELLGENNKNQDRKRYIIQENGEREYD